MKKERQDSLNPLDWLRYAERDWKRVNNRLGEDDPEDAGFHLQQAIEKYLKAFLLANGWKLEKMHELSTLIKKALPYKPELGNFIDLCERIENYYFVERYPLFLETGITLEEVERDFKKAYQLREKILEAFEKKPEDMMQPEKSKPEILKASPDDQMKDVSTE